jgi:hypothetical protein
MISEVFAAVEIHVIVFWSTTYCTLVCGYHHADDHTAWKQRATWETLHEFVMKDRNNGQSEPEMEWRGKSIGWANGHCRQLQHG